MPPKTILFIMARFFIPISAAVVAALTLGIITHYLGIPRSIIRSDSLIAATFLGFVVAGTTLLQRNK